MLVVGLTGGIATGKSSVSKLLASQHGVPVVDADLLARKVVEPGTRALRQIVKAFGPDILTVEGSLDRAKLGKVIFNDSKKRQTLNNIVHPAVHRVMLWAIFKLWITGHKWCVLDVPLLIEGGIWKWVAKVIVVYCSPDLQLERLLKRDSSKPEDASARINSQMAIDEKAKYADEIIDNSGVYTDLEAKVDTLVRRMDGYLGWSWMISWLCPPFAFVNGSLYLLRKRLHRGHRDKKN